MKITNDKTLEREALKRMQFLIKEYKLVKCKKHPHFKFVADFYNHHNLKRQNFIKYFNRHAQKQEICALLPQKRGPKYKTRRPLPFIEHKVLELRKLGNNRYEIHSVLKDELKQFTPSPSGIYNIIKRHGLNRLHPTMKSNKRRIIKTKAGELGHVDCHYLERGIVKNYTKRLYLFGIIDDCSRVVWVEVIANIKALTVMFAALKSSNILHARYNIIFEAILSDNGPEFSCRSTAVDKRLQHPFERMLIELGVKHRTTKPYRPQTNGKIERFWKTLKEDLLEDVVFESVEELREELLQYCYYYNHLRPHQGIGGSAPYDFLQNLSSN